jgi:hypothetical protein
LTDDEREIMALRRKRPDPHLNDVANQLLKALKRSNLTGDDRMNFFS